MLGLKLIVFFRRDSNLKSILLDCWRLFYFEHCLMNLKFRSKSKNILNTSKHCQGRSLEILLYTISFTKKCTRWKNLTFLGGVNWQTPVTVIMVEVHSMNISLSKPFDQRSPFQLLLESLIIERLCPIQFDRFSAKRRRFLQCTFLSRMSDRGG